MLPTGLNPRILARTVDEKAPEPAEICSNPRSILRIVHSLLLKLAHYERHIATHTSTKPAQH